MFGFGLGEFLVIAFVVLLMFGGKKLPALGKSIGQSINSFKKGLNEDDEKPDKKGED